MVNKKTNVNITAIIKTFNADKYLYEVLEAVKDLNEIIIVDYHSTDDTIQIACEYKAKIVYCDKNDYSNLNHILSQAQNDWVITLNQNEIVPKNLITKISNYIENPLKNKNIVSLSKKTFYLNKEIRFLRSRKEIRLFRKDLCNLEYDFSIIQKNKSKIHCINRNFKFKNQYILHFVDNDISRNLQNIIEDSRNILKKSKNATPSIILKPLFTFLKYYFLSGGIFEGRLGFLFCKMKYIENFIYQIMILENNFKGDIYDI